MDKKPLDLETLRLKIAKQLYEDTFKEKGGPHWLTIPVDVRQGFMRMVGVMFNQLFEEEPVALAEFFVDEGLNKEEFDLIVLQARQQGKTFRTMQQQNAFVQRSALFSMADDMLKMLYNIIEDTPQATDYVLAELQAYTDALEQIKEASDPVKMREAARVVEPGAIGEGVTILGADGKPMVPDNG